MALRMTMADDLQRRAEDFADLSIKFVLGLPHTLIAQRLGGQYLDASTSVATNYRAARRGRSYKEFAAKLGIVSEEADECVFWLQRISNADIKSTIATGPLLSEAEELARIFCASARTARGRRGGRND
jgi:four helix bundle protein